MRWVMLPVSAAAHVAVFLGTLIVPLATGVEAPTPWPASAMPEFVAVSPAPPPPVLRAVATARNPDLAPIDAPDHIEPPTVDDPAPGPVIDGAGDSIGAPVGVTGGVPNDGVSFPPVVLSVPLPPPPHAAYRPGGLIREPRKLVDVAPVYPDIARAARVEGLVILEATIDERGLVTDARVLRSVPLLDAAALAALKQWRYTPTLLNGVPVRVLMTVTFRFSLGDPPALVAENSDPPAPARSRRSAAEWTGAEADGEL
jgi:protein TonB